MKKEICKECGVINKRAFVERLMGFSFFSEYDTNAINYFLCPFCRRMKEWDIMLKKGIIPSGYTILKRR